MKNRISILSCLSALALCSLLAGCSRYSNTIPDWPWYDSEDPDSAWTDVTAGYEGLPSYVSILKAPARLRGKKAVAYVAKIDMSGGRAMNVWGLDDPELDGSSDALRTPMECRLSEGSPCIVINGGYFYYDEEKNKNHSASLAISEGTLLSPNINYASEDWKTMYRPTRGVFLQKEDGSFVTGWSYWNGENHWLYSSPAANSWSASPLQIPDENFPVAAEPLSAKNGIGGGPVLIKGGKIVASYRQELFDGETSGILCDTRHPRTAIGVTSDNHLILFVCEGREMTEGVPGYTLDELAVIMQDLGCTEAMNLDGGGSTCMLVNGTEMVKPSDGEERPVGSCVYIK